MTATDEETARLCPPTNAFENSTIRRIFMGRVFSLVALQLIAVTASVLICMQVECIYHCLIAEDNFYLVCGALGASIATYIVSVVLYCFVSVVHKRVPDIIVLLLTVTASSAVTFSIVCTTFGLTVVVVFLEITVSCCVGLSILSLISTEGLDIRRGLIFCVTWGACSTAFALWIPFSTDPLKIGAGCVSVITMVIMVYDIHRIMDRCKENVPSLVSYLDAVFELHSDIFIEFTILIVVLALLVSGRCAMFRGCVRPRKKFVETHFEAHSSPDDGPEKPTDSRAGHKL